MPIYQSVGSVFKGSPAAKWFLIIGVTKPRSFCNFLKLQTPPHEKDFLSDYQSLIPLQDYSFLFLKVTENVYLNLITSWQKDRHAERTSHDEKG